MVGGPVPGAGVQRTVFWSGESDNIPSFFLNAARPEGGWPGLDIVVEKTQMKMV